MANPVLVEVTRGGRVECIHRGAYALVDAEGAVVHSVGDIETPIFPRSAVKPFQTVPAVVSGAAAACGFGDEALALACASHNGEPEHAAVARQMLEGAGLTEADLECGAHPSISAKVAQEMAASGIKPRPLTHTCSGKHAAMLALAKHIGAPTKGYVAPDHPVQREMARVLAAFSDFDTANAEPGVDGCSVPTWAIPLRPLALACARFAAGEGIEPALGEAAKTIYDAAIGHPFYVAGTGRFGTDSMAALGGRALVKFGAEGVYLAMMREKRLGFAMKIDDGAKRAAKAVCAAVLARLFEGEPGAEYFAERANSPVVSVLGEAVGEIRFTGELP